MVLHTHTRTLTHTCRHLYSTQLLRFSNKSHAWIVNISTCALGTNERQLLLLSSRHFMPIYMNSYIKCVFNTTYISAYMYVCLCIWQIQVYLQISVLKSLLALVRNVWSCNFTILAFCTFSMCHQAFVVVDIVGN